MFDNGTKVIVVASSLRKGTGPRIGSIGYISSAGNNRIYYDTTTNIITEANYVNFIRYGFEKSLRNERRLILAAFPFCTNESTSNIIDHGLDLVNNTSLDKGSSWYDILRRVHGYNEISAVAIVVPVCAGNLLTCPIVEFLAWADSHIKDPVFNATAQALLIDNGYSRNKTAINLNHLNGILLYSTNKEYRKQVISGLDNDKATDHLNRETIVKTIRGAMVTSNRLSLNRILFHLNYSIESGLFLGGGVPVESISQDILRDIFSMAKHPKREAFLRNLNIKGVTEILNKAEEIKSGLRTVVGPMVETQVEVE